MESIGAKGRAGTVSVVIPTFNRAPVLREAIESALAQTYRDLEVLVVDDGSTDGTADVVRSIGDPRVSYVRQANAGVSIARNTGVAASRGELISFLDSDDLWKPHKVEREIALFEQHPDVQAVFSDAEKYEGDRWVPSFMRETPVFSKRLDRLPSGRELLLTARDMFLCLLEEVPIVTVAFTVRREAFQRAGGFHGSWVSFEDWEFFLRLARDVRFAFIDETLAVIRISPDSLHVRDAERGRSAMLDWLGLESRRLAHDREAQAAARRGVARLAKRLAWLYLERGRGAAAVRSYLEGFRIARDPRLLLGAAAWWLPQPLRRSARRALQRQPA